MTAHRPRATTRKTPGQSIPGAGARVRADKSGEERDYSRPSPLFDVRTTNSTLMLQMPVSKSQSRKCTISPASLRKK